MLARYIYGPVPVCVCVLQVGVLLKLLNVESQQQNCTIARGVYFSDAKDLREILPGSSLTLYTVKNTGAIWCHNIQYGTTGVPLMCHWVPPNAGGVG